MDNYSKYKERTPEDTILTVQTILNRIGLFPVLSWGGENRDGFYSNRITLYPTSCGVNGKGRDELYSSASGYGELMERLQNNLLLDPPIEVETVREAGFYYAPDEESVPLEEILADPDPFTRWILSELAGEDELSDGKAFLKLFRFEDEGTDCLRTIPFADPANNRIVRVPSSVALNISGSNGMAAGNTLEEAMVQGLSELLEREVNLRLLSGTITPPEIPDEALEPYDFYEQIKELRSDTRYRVSILDCSLGKGWPVAALCINDPETGTFGIQLGAHPSFPVAVERTLTEAAQGQKLSDYVRTNRLGTIAGCFSNSNRGSIIRSANGLYPASIFSGKPSWKFQPWTRFQKTGNHAFLAEMIRLLKEEGYEPLFRDASFLGFPACFMLIPRFQTITDLNGARVRRKRTENRAASDWEHFPYLNDTEATRLLRLIRYHKNTPGHRILNTVCGAPTRTKAYSNERLGAYLSLQLKNYSQADEFFRIMLAKERDEPERQYLVCMMRYCSLIESGMTRDEVLSTLRHLYTKAAAERVEKETSDLSKILETCFEKLPCPNCDTCRERGKSCQYEETKQLYIKVAKAMKKETVSQERLLELLRDLETAS